MSRGVVLRVTVGLLLSASCLLPAGQVQAEPQRWAAVIGIGQYKDPTIRRLDFAVADAKAMYDFLVDPTGGGFPKGNVQLLLDAQATQVALRSALGTVLARQAVQGDTVFIYYAGHGAPEVDLGNREPDGYAKYLVPYDANPKDLFATAINMGEVETFFGRIRADTVVLALDTCYSGAGAGRGFTTLQSGRRDISLTGDFLARLSKGKGRAILTAADTNEVALELSNLGHGLFTYYILEGLKGGADAQGKGYVTLNDLYSFVHERVARESRRAGGNQNPQLIAQTAGEIVLAGRTSGSVGLTPLPRPPDTRVPGQTEGPSAQTIFERAERLHKEGDLGGALKGYEQAIALNPRFSLAYIGRASIRQKQGDVLGALADWDQVASFDPERAAKEHPGKGIATDMAKEVGDLARKSHLDPMKVEDYARAVQLVNSGAQYAKAVELLRSAKKDIERQIKSGW